MMRSLEHFRGSCDAARLIRWEKVREESRAASQINSTKLYVRTSNDCSMMNRALCDAARAGVRQV
jgi:hypothetical protein